VATVTDHIPSLGFLGAGNMAGALLRGTVGQGGLRPETVLACDIDAAKLQALHAELGIRTTDSAARVLEQADTIVLAVKPQQMEGLLAAIREHVRPRHLLISIAAGLPLARLAGHLPEGTRLVRVMPNTPALVGRGAAGVARGPHATAADLQAALALFNAVGIAVEVAEADLDAVTALSGSGPAYVFRVIELMQQAGEEMGLAPEVARRLTLQTVLGAAHLADASDVDPAELRRRVTSPGGTTAAALAVFEERGLAEIFKAGIHRARQRAIELAGG
jgi:pyrroline-5-carboxylate reductase